MNIAVFNAMQTALRISQTSARIATQTAQRTALNSSRQAVRTALRTTSRNAASLTSHSTAEQRPKLRYRASEESLHKLHELKAKDTETSSDLIMCKEGDKLIFKSRNEKGEWEAKSERLLNKDASLFDITDTVLEGLRETKEK